MYAYRLYQRATLRGDLASLDEVDEAIDEAIEQTPLPDDLYLLMAKLALKLHRLSDVRRIFATTPSLSATAEGRAMLADLAFQEGRYEEARQGYDDVRRESRTWDNLARLAHLSASSGDVAGDDR